MRHQNKFIYKANGAKEVFSKRKLVRSLERTGLRKNVCESIAHKVAQEVRPGDLTKTIYKKALSLVKETSPVATAHYSLKKALFELGPEGHHFEVYVSRYFEKKGYKTQTCQILQGRFVRHEVDNIARRDKELIFSECKFHNRAGTKNDIKISLYVKARWDDLKQGPDGKDLSQFFVISNTAFTTDAITYANGTGLGLLGVNSPPEHSFLEEIKAMKLYPVTSLRSIGHFYKKLLLGKDIVLAEEVIHQQAILLRSGMTSSQLKSLNEEIKILLKETI